MELLLWRWSTLVQAVSELLIATFFLALVRSLKLPDLRTWSHAWLCNLVALVAVSLFWTLQPQGAAPTWFSYFIYLSAKSMFVLLAVAGSMALAGDGRHAIPLRLAFALAATFAAIGASVSLHAFDLLGILQSAMVGVVFSICTIYLLRRRAPRCGWLATGLGMRALLGLGEAAGYLVLWKDSALAMDSPMGTLMAAHSSLDAAAEWVIALASLLAFHDVIQRDLARTNGDLREAQGRLQDLLQRDQLTGAFNRRALPGILEDARANGAGILFFDIDNFKHVNDSHGHHAGDSSLVRFAEALSDNFRAGDRIVRFAGDEFIVVASDTRADALRVRIDAVRRQLDSSRPGEPALEFSVGTANLPPGGDPDAALRKADQAMYADKAARQAGSA